MAALIPYNPNDATQQGLLAGIRSGEAPRGTNPYTGGYGNVDLSGAPTSSTGFPQWAGGLGGTTHAAGAYQFQPGTWEPIASAHGLDFSKPGDQDAAAWYNAQQNYPGGGAALTSDLQSGRYGQVGSSLHGQWQGVNSGTSFSPAVGGNTDASGNATSGGSFLGPGQTMGTVDPATGLAPVYDSNGQQIGMVRPNTSTGSTGSTTDQPSSGGSNTGTTSSTAGGNVASGGTNATGSTEAATSTTGYPVAVGLIPGLATAIGTWLTGAETSAANISKQSSSDLNTTALGATSSFLSAGENWVLRLFLIIAGVGLLIVAVWKLLADQGFAPQPKTVAKSALRFA